MGATTAGVCRAVSAMPHVSGYRMHVCGIAPPYVYCSPVCVLLPRMHVPFELSLVFLILVPFGMGCACACGGVCMAQVMGDMQSDVGEMGGMRFMPPSIGHGPDGESWFIFIG